MDKEQMRKFYDIARTTGVTWVYVAYIEDVLLGRVFDGEELVKQIYDAAINKRDTLLRKRKDAILNNIVESTVTQMTQARYFARFCGAIDQYAQYIEGLVLENRQFDLEQCVESVFNAAMMNHECRVMHKILVGTRITIGGHNAV